MFFRRRSAQAEYFDLPSRPESETLAAFRDLDRLNRAFLFERPFAEILPHWLGEARCRRLEILDVGAGTGLLGRKLSAWAEQRGWNWQFTNLDFNPLALKLGGVPRAVAGSALRLPFKERSFDLILASQMTHHLTDEDVVLHLREAWRVTRDALLLCDLHRNAGLYAMLWLSMPWLRIGQRVREDALISVKRGFRLGEWRELARRAGLREAQISLYYGTRILLAARRDRDREGRDG